MIPEGLHRLRPSRCHPLWLILASTLHLETGRTPLFTG